MSVAVRARMLGSWVDLTPWTQTLQLSVGHRAGNAVGSVAGGCYGVIQLLAWDGHLSPYAPGRGIDPGPGVEVEVRAGSTLIFRGWSTGIQMQLPASEQYIATMPLIGPLKWLGVYHPRLFTTLPSQAGTLRTDRLLDVVLDEVGWPEDRRRLDVGRTILVPVRVRQSGILGRSRRLVELRPALAAIAAAEMGRIYDDRQGDVVFESRLKRGIRSVATPDYVLTDTTPGVVVRSVETRPLSESVLNVVEGRTKGVVSKGVQDLSFQETITGAFEVAAGRDDALTLTLDLDGMGAVYVQSYKPLVAGTHYTLTGDDAASAVVSLRPSDEEVLVEVDNREGGAAVTLTMIKIEGEPFAEAPGRTIAARNEASVARYGERLLSFPNDLIENLEELRDHIDFLLAVHGGVAADGSGDVSLFRTLDVECLLRDGDSLAAASPSEVVALTVSRLGLSAAPFYIDEVTHEVDGDGAHRMTLRVVDARATVMWGGARFEAGITTRVGF